MDTLNVFINRSRSSDHGTEGCLSVPEVSFSCFTLELPWRDNASSVSCIPAGSYPCRLVQSPKFGRVYHVCDVPGRSHILTHSGNFAGDASLGLRTHSHGCILLGAKRGVLDGQRAVLVSRPTLRRFLDFCNGAELRLTITGGDYT